MMALATSTLVNGEWTTQTLDVNSVLQHYDQQDKEAAAKFSDVERPPVHGLLTQTIIRSPQAHWILPVKIRNPHANDVAFIGEDFVQIRELRPDGHLCDIIRKENFGAKIHNARVIGSIKAYYEDPDTGSFPPKDIARDSDNDISMGGTPRAYPQPQGLGDTLPPQTIVLHLDSGDFCFLMLREEKYVGLKFVSTRHRVSKPMLTSPIIKSSIFKPSESTTDKTFSKLFGESASIGSPLRESPSRASLSALQAGMHLAVDPSSRYMAIGCSQDIFAIYELHTRGDLKEQQAKGIPLRHIESERYITFPGVIHKMEFLYPSADDEGHIILVILVVRGGQTRMVVFEWQAGMDLRKISAHSKKGHLLEEARRMPLLLIPLTIKSAFILVSESSMAVCQDILSGSPRCVDFNTEFDPPTSLHYGLGPPLWVAWTRPPRLGYHTAFRDDLYIAREDGLVKFFEIDSEEFVNAEIKISHFQCNVGTALASVEYQKFNDPGRSGDLLITGGDSCAGGTYLVRAREFPQFTETVHNWSPAIDFVTTFSTQDLHRQRKGAIPSPDRIFVCNGMGTKGAISEFRYGLEAAVGTIIPYDTPIMKAWVLSPSFDLTMEGAGLLFLMSLGNCSAMVKLSSDASQAEAIDSESTLFDLESRTIAVGAFGNLIRQVTERSIIVSNGDRAHIHNGKSLLDMATAVENAVIYEDVVLYTTLFGSETILRVLTPESTQAWDRFDSAMHGGSIVTLQRFSSRITSLALCLVGQHLCAIVAAWGEEFIELTFQPINGAQSHTLQLPTRVQKGAISLDAVISMVVAPGTSIPSAHDSIVLLCGTRNGFLVTLDVIVEDTVRIIDSRCDRFGVTSTFITKDEPQFRPTINIKEDGSQKWHDSYFVSCGSSVCTITPGAPHPKGYESTEATLRRGRRVEQIWLTDALNPTLQQPEIVSVVRIPDIFGGTEGGNLLVVAGSDLILARLSPQQKAVPRHLSIQGTPKRVLYSHDLQVLIVAAIVNGRTTLLFIDPDTGEDLSKAIDKTGVAVECDPGLGKPNETILGLLDWPFSKDGRLWRYLVITTSSGRVLLISYEKETGLAEEASTTKPRICFRTRFKFKHTDPVSAVTGIPEGIIYCSGDTLYCEFLDRDEKKFRRVAQYKLSSPARSLTVRDDTIYAMTAAHSLEVLRFERGLNGDASKITATHFDQNHRFGLHHLEISGSDSTGVGVQLSLVTDKDTSVAGLWATSNTKADTLDTVFEAEMQSSIQKLRIGRCRPIWDPVWALEAQLSSAYPQPPPSGTQAALGDQYSVSVLDSLDIVRTSDSETEILGLTMDGSLHHFTILGETAWSFLRLIQNMAIRSPTVCQFIYDSNFEVKPSLNPKTMMHVNGDILKRVLEERMLAHLLSITRAHTLFAVVLNNLHRREPGLIDEMEKDPSLYVEQAYADLEYYLRPVL